MVGLAVQLVRGGLCFVGLGANVLGVPGGLLGVLLLRLLGVALGLVGVLLGAVESLKWNVENNS